MLTGGLWSGSSAPTEDCFCLRGRRGSTASTTDETFSLKIPTAGPDPEPLGFSASNTNRVVSAGAIRKSASPDYPSPYRRPTGAGCSRKQEENEATQAPRDRSSGSPCAQQQSQKIRRRHRELQPRRRNRCYRRTACSRARMRSSRDGRGGPPRPPSCPARFSSSDSRRSRRGGLSDWQYPPRPYLPRSRSRNTRSRESRSPGAPTGSGGRSRMELGDPPCRRLSVPTEQAAPEDWRMRRRNGEEHGLQEAQWRSPNAPASARCSGDPQVWTRRSRCV